MKHSIIAALLLGSAVTTVHGASVPGVGTWESTLQGRDLDGNAATAEAYYDTVLDITWLADANYAKTTGFDADGGMKWSEATAWVAGLDPYDSGITGWRLPATVDVGNDGATYTNIYQGVDSGYNIATHSEMSHMFYVTLGELAYLDTSGYVQPDSFLDNTGPFANLLLSTYWSATEYAPYNTIAAWVFYMDLGYQGSNLKSSNGYAWAVHSGDVGATVVPVPAAVWLFGSVVLALAGVGTRRRR